MHYKLCEVGLTFGCKTTDAAPATNQTSFFKSISVEYSHSHPTLYVVHGRAKAVLSGPNSTEPNLFHYRETTYRLVQKKGTVLQLLLSTSMAWPAVAGQKFSRNLAPFLLLNPVQGWMTV